MMRGPPVTSGDATLKPNQNERKRPIRAAADAAADRRGGGTAASPGMPKVLTATMFIQRKNTQPQVKTVIHHRYSVQKGAVKQSQPQTDTLNHERGEFCTCFCELTRIVQALLLCGVKPGMYATLSLTDGTSFCGARTP